MTKFKIGQLVWNKSLKEKGKVIAIDENKAYTIEVIKKYDKLTKTRTTTLTTWYEDKLDIYRKPKAKRKPKSLVKVDNVTTSITVETKDENWNTPTNNQWKEVIEGVIAKLKESDEDILYFAKVKPEGVIPSKREEDGCYDIYCLFDEDEVVIKPHEIHMFSTGIATAVSSKYRLDFKRERGSTGTIGMVPRSGQVDSGYRGEVFVPIQNTTNKDLIISKKAHEKKVYSDATVYPYTKAICQMAVELVPKVKPKVITFEALQAIPSERGAGALGSSGK